MTDTPPLPDPALLDEMLDRWLPGAMFPSEVVWLAGRLRTSGVRVVIECGRQDGVSTWTLASLLKDDGIKLLSIDFDDDLARLERTEQTLQGLDVRCVSGDIHVQVPVLLDQLGDLPIAIVQDGPKGWEGMATLLAGALDGRVRLVAQHNLQRGHLSRTAFQMLSMRPCFLEVAEPWNAPLSALREREQAELAPREPNRPLDHTSLGVIELDGPGREHFESALPLLQRRMEPWNPLRVRSRWDRGDHHLCSRIRKWERVTPFHFKRR